MQTIDAHAHAENEKKIEEMREKFMFFRCMKEYDECRYTLFGAKRRRKKINGDRMRRTTCMRKKAKKNSKSQLLVQNS
jgi:hypothetical protein